MAYNGRSGANRGKSKGAFKKRANKTHRLNMMQPLRGGIRL